MSLFSKLFGGSGKNTNFTPSASLMNEEQFWGIIETANNNADGDFEELQDELANELRQLTPDEIILFSNRFRYFRGEANTWELWGAIYIIHGGCGDDSFNDFREWVIGQGREFYYKTINDPESLVEFETDSIDEVDWEGLGYIPATVFTSLTGQDIASLFEEKTEPTGTEWTEDGDDLKKMFPKLAAKYPDHV
jgi:hypothetical protein